VPTATVGVAWSVGRSISLSVSITTLSSAKMAELIDLAFGLWTQVGPRNHALDGSLDLHT